MNEQANFDIIMKSETSLKELEPFLNQLVDSNLKGIHKIIIWSEYGQQEEAQDTKIKDIPVVSARSESEISKLAENDIFILCPDLVIPQDVLEQITAFAYSEPEIAVVSPMVAEISAQKELQTIDFEKIHLPGTWEISSCSSYCLFIKQDIVQALGKCKVEDIFSSDFEKLINKTVQQLGRRQELCPKAVIFHKALTGEYENDFGYPEITDNIRLHKKLVTKKKTILYVIQADFSRDASNNIGGTQLHVKDLAEGIESDYRVIVAARDGDSLRVTVYTEAGPCMFRFYIGRPKERPIFYDADQRKLFMTILNAFSIDLVHVHHTYSFSMEIYEAAAQCKIPVIATLHDFYFLCPTIKMFDHNSQCCIGKETEERCRACLNKLLGIEKSIDYIRYWRMHTYHYLQLCDKIIVPSENAKDIISRYFPQISQEIQVIEHGYDGTGIENDEIIITPSVRENVEIIDQSGQCTEIRGWAYYQGKNNNSGRIYLEITDSSNHKVRIPTYKMERGDVAQGNYNNLKTGFKAFVPNSSELSGKEMKIQVIVTIEDINYSSGKVFELDSVVEKDTDNLRVAFIGGLNAAKGSRQIYDIIKKNMPGIDWYIFGGIDDEKLSEVKMENLTWTNFYQRDDLETYLNLHKIDIIVILSLWPETFCYTLSEAVAYKRPVIAADVGALGARTKEMQCGWTVPLENIVPETEKVLERIKKKPEEYRNMCEHVRNIKMRSLAEMDQEYLALYKKILLDAPDKEMGGYDTQQIYQAWQEKTVAGENSRTISAEEYQAYIIKLEQDIENIKESRTYKLARKIAHVWTTLRGKRS